MGAQNRQKSILFIDDEPALVKMNVIYLKRNGFDVKGTIYGAEALKWFRDDPQAFDVVITDLSMPGLNGEEMIMALRDIRPDIGIIVLSGTMLVKQPRMSGNILYLEKPVDPKKLLDGIQLLLA